MIAKDYTVLWDNDTPVEESNASISAAVSSLLHSTESYWDSKMTTPYMRITKLLISNIRRLGALCNTTIL